MEHALPDPGTSKRLGAARWRLALSHPELEDALGSLDFESAPKDPRLTLRKSSPRVFWAELNLEGECFFVKGRREIRPRRLLASMVKTAPLRREWRKTWWLRSQGLDTVEPVAVGELRRLRQLHEEFFVSRYVGTAESLQEHLVRQKELLPVGKWQETRQDVVRRVGRVFGLIHTVGAYHRQFFAANLLTVEEPGRGLRLIPIDFKHLSTPSRFTDEDWLWSFYLLLWWLGEPVMTWETASSDLASFAAGYHQGVRERRTEQTAVFSASSMPLDNLVDLLRTLVSRKPTVAPRAEHRARVLRELRPHLKLAVASSSQV
jgi:hypothetical protein